MRERIFMSFDTHNSFGSFVCLETLTNKENKIAIKTNGTDGIKKCRCPFRVETFSKEKTTDG